MSPSIKWKLLAASLLLLLLAAFAQGSGVSAALLARAVLGALACAGLAAWLIRARRSGGRPAGPGAFRLPPPLAVVARAGLSARSGMALVEADGRRYLVAFGDGFAQLLDALPRQALRGGAGGYPVRASPGPAQRPHRLDRPRPPRPAAQARAGRRPSPRRAARKGGRP